MKEWQQVCKKLLNEQRRLRPTQYVIIGLAILLMVGLGSQRVSASSSASFAFHSPLPEGTPHPGDEGRELLKSIINVDQLTANVLGISLAELQAARNSGKRLDELIKTLGLDEATVHQELKTAVATAVQQAVANGQITQEEANKLLNPPADRGHGHGPDHDPGHTPKTPGATITPTSAGGTIPPASGTPAATTTAGNTTTNQEEHTATTHDTKHGSHEGHASNAQTNHSQNTTTSTSNSSTDNSAQNDNQNSNQPQNTNHRGQRHGR